MSMTLHIIIQQQIGKIRERQQIGKIRERQEKSTLGEWKQYNGDEVMGNEFHRIAYCIPRASDNTRESQEDFNNAKYTAAACSPEDGDLTRLLSAVEVMAEAVHEAIIMAEAGLPVRREKLQHVLTQVAAALAGKEGV